MLAPQAIPGKKANPTTINHNPRRVLPIFVIWRTPC